MAKPAPGPAWSVSPTEWGARVDYDKWNDRWVPKDKVIVHYGGGENIAGSVNPDPVVQVADEKYMLRRWEAYHIDGRGWRGIAYCYAVGQSGTVYRLRGWNLNGAQYNSDDLDADGIPENSESVPVVFILGGDQEPTVEALAAFVQLRGYLNQTMEARLLAYGHLEAAASGGHSTACPGVHLMAYVETHRDLDPEGWPELQRGVVDPAVRSYRVMLHAAGFRQWPRVHPQKFGRSLDKATRRLQRAYDEQADGIVGEKTKAALLRALEATI